MRIFKKSFLMLVLFIFSFALNVQAQEKVNVPQVEYDVEKNILSVEAKKVSLKSLLAIIQLETGVQFFINPTVEKKISIKFKNLSIEKGLKKIAKGLSYSFSYKKQSEKEKKDKKENLLIAMLIVKQGQDFKGAMPVLGLEGEGTFRTKRDIHEKGDGFDKLENKIIDRWKARYDLQSPERQKKIEENIKKRYEKNALRLKTAEERKIRNEKMKKERKERIKKVKETRRKNMTSEQYEKLERKRQETLEEYKKQVRETDVR